MLSPLPILTLSIVSMLILCGVAAAFRSTSSAVGIGSNAISSSAPRVDDSNRTTPSSTSHPDKQSRVSSSTVGGAVQAASDTMKRHRRTYWDELAPPFGIRGGLLKKRRKANRRNRSRSGGSGESWLLADSTHDAENAAEVGTETVATARSIAKGRIISDTERRQLGDDTEMDSNRQSDYVSLVDEASLEYTSDHNWEDDDDDTVTSGDSDYSTTSLCLVSGENKTSICKTSICFLVHGHRGLSRDLGYLHAAIHGRLSEVRRHRRKELRNQKSAGSDSAVEHSCSSFGHDVVVHSAMCNEGRTDDGVRAGGDRLVEEMLQVIRTEADRKRRQKKRLQESKAGDSKEEDELAVDITISLVGNSLGGIYSRYAVAQLFHMAEIDGCCADNNDALLLDSGAIRLHFQTFCTTATPHLGCARHTWISLPRPAEIAVGHILGETGRDLFRMSNLLHEMGTDEYYLSPLSKFRKRVAYANGYHTDFPVPAATAAFLHEDSEYPHHFLEERTSTADSELDKYIVATLRTQPTSSLGACFAEVCDDDLKEMSTALDSLGWKKVIVDLRHEISIRMSVPRVLRSNNLIRKKRSLSSSSFRRGFQDSAERSSSAGKRVVLEKQQEQLLRAEDNEIVDIGDDNDEDRDEPMMNTTLADSRAHRESLRRKATIASRDAKAAFASPRDGSIHLPVGHNMICAFSRGRVSSHLNRGGRPVMDSLAREMVDDMICWDSAQRSP